MVSFREMADQFQEIWLANQRRGESCGQVIACNDLPGFYSDFARNSVCEKPSLKFPMKIRVSPGENPGGFFLFRAIGKCSDFRLLTENAASRLG